jgi:pSer/pThr/pTyr-binding forkhead associated (FHA) protein
MAKFCANGHQMEDSWEICPYCQKTGYTGVSLAKTRVESEPRKPAVAVARKTVVLAETQKAPVVGWLVALDGNHRGEDFRVREGQNILGSEPGCEIVLEDSTISGRHASLRYKDGKFIFSDLDSTNGSYVNDAAEPVARVEIKDNDIVRMGNVRLKFKCL